jgi:hypothetical protein
MLNLEIVIVDTKVMTKVMHINLTLIAVVLVLIVSIISRRWKLLGSFIQMSVSVRFARSILEKSEGK